MLVVVQCLQKVFRITQTHPIAFSETTALYMVEHWLFNTTQFTQTHLIASLKTTALKMAEQCFLKLPHFTPTHLIAISQTIKQVLVVQYSQKIFQPTQTHLIAFLKIIWLKLTEVLCTLSMTQFIPFLLFVFLIKAQPKILQVLRYIFIKTHMIKIHGTAFFIIIQLVLLEELFIQNINLSIKILQIPFFRKIMQLKMVVQFILKTLLIKIHRTILLYKILLVFLGELYFLIKILSIKIKKIINFILIAHLNKVVQQHF